MSLLHRNRVASTKKRRRGVLSSGSGPSIASSIASYRLSAVRSTAVEAELHDLKLAHGDLTKAHEDQAREIRELKADISSKDMQLRRQSITAAGLQSPTLSNGAAAGSGNARAELLRDIYKKQLDSKTDEMYQVMLELNEARLRISELESTDKSQEPRTGEQSNSEQPDVKPNGDQHSAQGAPLGPVQPRRNHTLDASNELKASKHQITRLQEQIASREDTLTSLGRTVKKLETGTAERNLAFQQSAEDVVKFIQNQASRYRRVFKAATPGAEPEAIPEAIQEGPARKTRTSALRRSTRGGE